MMQWLYRTVAIVLLLFLGVSHAADRLNILLITADDLGPQLSCYGDSIAKTPEIDDLAKHSVQFQTAYVSQASCSPSRSTMLTGLYPHGNGHYGLANANVGFQLHPELRDNVLPNVLKRAGYRTGVIGKLHVNPEDSFQFDMRQRDGFGNRLVRKQLQYAKEFVSQSDGQPWFLMFNLFDPHVARERLANGNRGPQYFPDQVEGLPESVLTAQDVPPWPWQQMDSRAQRTKIAGYYNCVHRIDAAIGMLRQMLQKSGHWDDTLIIFLGDLGPPFARGKTSCYEAGLRVPFLARWPGVSEPHVSNRLVGSVDIYPTILDAAGVEMNSPLHGRSLRPVLVQSELVDWRDTVVAEFHYHGGSPFFLRRAITDGRFKLIHNLRSGEVTASPSVDGDRANVMVEKLGSDHPARLAMERLADPPEWELYDLKDDPIEFDNRANDPAMAKEVSRLKQALAQWQQRTKDPFVDAGFRDKIERKYQKSSN
ncbi:sulfatase family protein [Crateriforma conspicua]|uniref:Arylsulfatase n=1 Tax=Crateriforma conspicua TaxID=2527996 RepID=A0A5C5YAQ8_9PLAN|nr:sulfatase [Crateriforma conspicua]TWT71405.1 Arylsulfatase [Crateriforma conspicua]